MNHISLFSGMGGFDLAAQWMGWENIAHCEWNPFCQKILKYYWPNAISYEDITKTDFSVHRGNIDILTGGFPCQPYSVAGQRKGKDDERHLWPHMLRAVREIKPRWVVGENVLGLVGWNGGLVFEEVQADLEAEGYEVQPYILPAAAVNAPHRRDRVWFVAYSERDRNVYDCGRGTILHNEKRNNKEKECRRHNFANGSYRVNRNATNSSSEGLQKSGQASIGELPKESREGLDHRLEQHSGLDEYSDGERFEELFFPQITDETSRISSIRHNEIGRGDWGNFPTQSPVCDGDDGLSARLDGITFSKWRNESIKAGGNAIVPKVVFEIFKAIEAYENVH